MLAPDSRLSGCECVTACDEAWGALGAPGEDPEAIAHCAGRGLVKGDPANPGPQELNSQRGFEAIQGVTNNGIIIICSQTHLYSVL